MCKKKFTQKSQAVAEKTANNFRGLLSLPHMILWNCW